MFFSSPSKYSLCNNPPPLVAIEQLICADHIGLIVLDVLKVAHSSDPVVVVFIFVKLLLLYFSRGVVEEWYVNLA